MKIQSRFTRIRLKVLAARCGRAVTAYALLFALLVTLVGVSDAETFRKTKLIDPKGRELAVELGFDETAKLLTVKAAGEAIYQVPYANIEKLSYEQASRHRIREGAVVMIFSLGAGGVVMLTKEKYHWFYVDFKSPAGEARTITLKLDKTEYKTVLSAATTQTGKVVETLEPAKGGPHQR